MKKNEQGFTLLELLAVIVLLGILSTIVVPIFVNTISTSKNALSKDQKNAIEDAAKTYTIKNDHCGCVSVETLQKEGYLEGKNIIDPKTNTRLLGGVSLTWEDNQFSYKYTESCKETTKISCEN